MQVGTGFGTPWWKNQHTAQNDPCCRRLAQSDIQHLSRYKLALG